MKKTDQCELSSKIHMLFIINFLCKDIVTSLLIPNNLGIISEA